MRGDALERKVFLCYNENKTEMEPGRDAVFQRGMKYGEGEEAVDMCQAIQEMRMEERLIGEQIGIQQGEQRGEQRGELKKAQEVAGNFYQLGIDVEKIAQGVGYAVETVKQWLGLSDDNE